MKRSRYEVSPELPDRSGRHAVSYKKKALSFVHGLDADSFAQKEETMFAVIRAREIVGEAAKHIPVPVRKKHPQVPWQKIAGTRDKLIHSYFDIHSDRLRATVKNDLPPLRAALQRILEHHDDKNGDV